MSRRAEVLHILAAATAAVAYAGLHAVIVRPMFADRGFDYAVHVDMGEALYHHHVSEPHFLYHLLIALTYATRIAPSFLAAARGILTAANAASVLLVYGAIWRALRKDPWLSSVPVVFVATLAAMSAQPIGHFIWYQIGYLWNDPYAIPTYTLLKPFAIAAFFLTAEFLFVESKPGWKLIAIYFLVIGSGALAKPSYLICLVPAVVILGVWRLRTGQGLSRRALLIGFGVPAFLVLSGQFLLTYAGMRGVVGYQDSIQWAPLLVMRHWASGLGGKFLLSTAFPLAVLLVYGRAAIRDGAMQLAWLTFAAGAAYAYLLSEVRRATDGNFLWSAYISLFVLFIASILFVLRQYRTASWWRPVVCGGVLAAHVISGIALDRKYLGWALDKMR
ncbi:MAG TPA: hypothetical protein VML19_02400 [Verrucomicrobiae bacterium]|nr:hypothetical protein [Verrucomicrobiae bacterium]